MQSQEVWQAAHQAFSNWLQVVVANQGLVLILVLLAGLGLISRRVTRARHR
jgi:hypothetical protein